MLVADDDALVREMIATMLRQAGFEVISAGDGAEAIALVREKGDQLATALVDLEMPHMNGLELQSELMARGLATPIVFITAYGEVSCAVTACKAGTRNRLSELNVGANASDTWP